MRLPLMYECEGKKVLVIGGGKVGYRKAALLHKNGAHITCISDVFDQRFSTLDQVQLIKSSDNVQLADTPDLVIAATNDHGFNATILQKYKGRGALTMCVDHLGEGDISFMSYEEKNQLTIAVTTDGQSPSYGKHLSGQLMSGIKEEVFQRLSLLGKIRKIIVTSKKTALEKRRIMNKGISMPMDDLSSLYEELKGQ